MKKVSSKKFEEAFDSGEDISSMIKTGSARRINEEQKRVNVDFPRWMVDCLDREASRMGISRQAVIKIVIGEKFKTAA